MGSKYVTKVSRDEKTCVEAPAGRVAMVPVDSVVADVMEGLRRVVEGLPTGDDLLPLGEDDGFAKYVTALGSLSKALGSVAVSLVTVSGRAVDVALEKGELVEPLVGLETVVGKFSEGVDSEVVSSLPVSVSPSSGFSSSSCDLSGDSVGQLDLSFDTASECVSESELVTAAVLSGRKRRARVKAKEFKLAKAGVRLVPATLPAGLCYVAALVPRAREEVAARLGFWPTARELLSVSADCFHSPSALASLRLESVGSGKYHVTSKGRPGSVSLRFPLQRLAKSCTFPLGSYGALLAESFEYKVRDLPWTLSLDSVVGGGESGEGFVAGLCGADEGDSDDSESETVPLVSVLHGNVQDVDRELREGFVELVGLVVQLQSNGWTPMAPVENCAVLGLALWSGLKGSDRVAVTVSRSYVGECIVSCSAALSLVKSGCMMDVGCSGPVSFVGPSG